MPPLSWKMDAKSLKAYQLWLKRRGVRFDGVQLMLDEEHGGVKVMSTRKIDGHSILVAVPEDILLSLRTLRSEHSDLLLEEGEFPHSSVLLLCIAAERARADASPWYPYFSMIPEAEDIPLLWSDADLRRLVGTGLDHAARARRASLEAVHGRMVSFLAGHGRGSSPLALGAPPAHPEELLIG